MEYHLQTPELLLSLTPEIFPSDLPDALDLTLHVRVACNGFSGYGEMDLTTGDLVAFSASLSALYETLSGQAVLKEPYGDMHLTFTSTPRGHIHLSGIISQMGQAGEQSIVFATDLEQSDLHTFCNTLADGCRRISP